MTVRAYLADTSDDALGRALESWSTRWILEEWFLEMAEGWYFSEVIGTGTMTDPYRAVVQDLLAGQPGAACSAAIGTDANGVPLKNVTLVHVDARDHAALTSDLRVIPFPTVTTRRWSGFDMTMRTRIAAWLTLHGLTLETSDDPTMPEVVTRLGVQVMPTFTEPSTRGHQ